MSKRNLLTETRSTIEDNGYKTDEVKWVGDKHVRFSWEHFEKIADFTYDSGFGGHKIIGSLVVVGEDWWMKRGEYDGSEWWEFQTMPEMPEMLIDLEDITTSHDWNNDVSVDSELLQANFETDEELQRYIRENNISKILDKKQ